MSEYNLLKPNDLETKLSRTRFNELVRLASQREAIDEVNGNEEMTVKEAIDTMVELGISPTISETAAYDYLRGDNQTPRLSTSVKAKAEVLESRLINLYNSIDIFSFRSEKEIPILEDLQHNGKNIKYWTRMDNGQMETSVSVATGKKVSTLFTIYIKKRSRSWMHDIYKKIKNKTNDDFKVVIWYDSAAQTVEEFLSKIVSNSNGNYHTTERFALKNLVPALEQDLRQAQGYADEL